MVCCGNSVRVSNYRHWLDTFLVWKDEKTSLQSIKSQISRLLQLPLRIGVLGIV